MSSATQGDDSDNLPRQWNSRDPMSNHFSCVSCRQRKIRCDKKQPCRSCTKARLNCVFPPLRRTSKAHKDADDGHGAKLQHLEHMVDVMKEHIEILEGQTAWNGPRSANIEAPTRMSSSQCNDPSVSLRGKPANSGGDLPQMLSSMNVGCLVRDHNKEVYVSGQFWTSIAAKVLETQTFLQPEDEGCEEQPSLAERETVKRAFPFEDPGSVRFPTHPRKEIRRRLWTVYKDNVQPLIPILHVPFIEAQLTPWLAEDEVETAPTRIHALLFAIYYASVSSLEDDLCQEILGDTLHNLAARYRTAVEQMLARAGLLSTDDIMIIQSLVIYLAVVRCYDVSLAGTLAALAFRLLQSIGAHRNGVVLGLSPFQSERYMRLSCVTCVFDCMAADDTGRDPTTLEASTFDLFSPPSRSSDQLLPPKTQRPEAAEYRKDCTVMAVYEEITALRLCIHDSRRCATGASKSFHAMTRAGQRRWISQRVQKFMDKHVRPRSVLKPLEWATATFARTLILEFKLLASRAVERYSELDKGECDEHLADALDCVEYAHKLRIDSRAQKWAWLFKSCTKWASLAFLLIDIAARPCQPNRAKVWRIAEQTMVSRWTSTLHVDGFQWRSMRVLMNMARSARLNTTRDRIVSIQGPHDAAEVGTGREKEISALQGRPSSHEIPSHAVQQMPKQPGFVSPTPETTDHHMKDDDSTSTAAVEPNSLITPVSLPNEIQDMADWSLLADFDMYEDVLYGTGMDCSLIGSGSSEGPQSATAASVMPL